MKKRLCIVQPSASMYSETFIGDQVRYLSERFDCRLLSGGYFPERFDTGRAIVPEDLLHRAWRSTVRRVAGVTWDCARRKALAVFFRKNAFELVLAEYGPTGAEIVESCRTAGVPLAVHFHGFDAYRENTIRTYAAPYREMFDYAAVLVAVSRDMRDQLVRLGAPPEKVVYNPYGVDTETFSGSTPATAPPTFVAVGRFVEKKAPHLTVLAFRHVAEQVPDARLVMVGDGPLLNACRQVAETAGLRDRVEFPGVGNRSQIAALMKSARAFVQHSVISPDGDCEGTPVAILEAGASGLPVVATRHAGIKDVVLEGETGLLVDEYDVKAMSDAMLVLAENPEKAGELGANARERIVSEFNREQRMGRLAQILEEAAKGGT